MLITIFIVIAAVLIVGIVVKYAVSRRESHRARDMRNLANRLKFKRVTAKGVDRTTTSISLFQHREYAFSNVYSGNLAGLGVTFFDMVCSLNTAENTARNSFGGSEMTTRVKVHLKGRNLPHFILVPQAVRSAKIYQLPKTTPITFPEDLKFNRDNVLLSDNADSVHHLFDSAGLRALFASNESMCVEGKRDSITIYCCNMQLSASQLEALIERAVKIAGTLNLPPVPTLQQYYRKSTSEPVRGAYATLSHA